MKLKHLAYTFRKSKKSKAEAALLAALKPYFRGKLKRNYKYQALLGNMIVDYWLKLKALVIEIDGPEHDKAKDSRRDIFLFNNGLITLRFTNNEVLKDPHIIAKQIMAYPDVFKTHAKAIGKASKLLAYNRFKTVNI